MLNETLEALKKAAQYKTNFIASSTSRYTVASILAGFYLGFGVFLIITIGALMQGHIPYFKVYMGASFGIALSLVVMTNSELFTGNNMIMLAGCLTKVTRYMSLLKVFIWSYIGNFIGAVLIAAAYVCSGIENGKSGHLIVQIATAKTTAPIHTLLIGGILCNMLICLAILLSLKMKSETAKLIMIFWCLFAFVTTGYEHSIVNMILLSAAKLLAPHAISFSAILYNLSWVTLGNIIGGSLIALAYTYLGNNK